MKKINNIDTSNGRVRFSYRIWLVVDDSSPISRMIGTLEANNKLNEWLANSRVKWNFLYKIDDNMLYLETLQIVERFKGTFKGKESRDYIIKSMRKHKPSKKKKTGE
jgi:hypothetical protein